MSGSTYDFAEAGSTQSVVYTKRSVSNAARKLYKKKATNINVSIKFNSLFLVLHRLCSHNVLLQLLFLFFFNFVFPCIIV